MIMEFTFNEKTHRYYLNGKAMTGCTTVLGMIAKPALISWSARMASEYVLENLKDLNDLEEVCEAAKNAHRMKRDKAAESGTDIHAVIEERIKDAIKNTNGIINGHDVNEEKQVSNFVEWTMNNKVKFLESEKRVYHGDKDKWYAGTLDFLCEIDNDRYIGDIKTSSSIYSREPFAQCAGYRHALEYCEPELAKGIQGSIIINIKKNGTFDEDKDVYLSTYYEDDLKLFLSALEIYRQLKNKFEPINANYTYQTNRRKKGS